MVDSSAPPPSPAGPFLIPITDRAAFLARVHFGVTISLLAVTLIPFCARLYVRIWPVWRFGWDDFLITAGFVSAISIVITIAITITMTPKRK
jgi:hypothetical protein